MNNIDEKRMTKEELQGRLAQFSVSEDFHKSSMFCAWIFHTDGIQWMANTAGAFWLIDVIVSWQTKTKVRREPFQVWKLAKREKRESKEDRLARLELSRPAPMEWVVTCTDGDKGYGPIELCRQIIPYSDFPLDEFTLFCENGSLDGRTTVKIIMLPNER